MIHGLKALAFLNTFLIARSDSPTYFENSYGPLIPIKLSFDSVAIALAIIVLLHPGGPYNSTPLLGWMPNSSNFYGYFKGNSVTFLI